MEGSFTHDYGRALKYALRRLEHSKISDADREVVARFADHMAARGVSKIRLATLIQKSVLCLEHLGAPLSAAGRGEVEGLIRWLIQESGYSQETLATTISVFKLLVKFARHGNVDRASPYPAEVAWVTPAMAQKASKKKAVNFIASEEAKRMVEAAVLVRDRALLAVEFEAGLRPSELLGLNVGDVRFERDAVYLTVHGKTGPRVVALFSSAPILARYLETHPYRENPGAPLWVVESNYRRGSRLGYPVLSRRIKRIAERAGVKKRVTLYAFRHGAATETAKYLTEPEQRIRYGWSPRSAVPSIYTHLNAQDVNQKLARIMAGKPLEVKPAFTPVKCVRCGHDSTPGSRFCSRCGTPLRPEDLAHASIAVEEVRREVSDLRRLVEKLLGER